MLYSNCNIQRIFAVLTLSFAVVLFQIAPFGPGQTKTVFAGSTLTPTPIQQENTPVPTATQEPIATDTPAPTATNTPAPPPTSVPSSGGSNTSSSPAPTPTELPPPAIPELGGGPSLTSLFVIALGLLLFIFFNIGRLIQLTKPEQK